jgi:hypothetical protein
MRLISATIGCRAASELGLTLLADKRGPVGPRGPTGHVEWEANAGLLREIAGSAWADDEAGSGRRFIVTSGPHEGRTVESFNGSAWFQPALQWVA